MNAHGPLATFARPSLDLGMLLIDVRYGADVNGVTPVQYEIATIADFDRLVAEHQPAFVNFGFYGYPRRPVYDLVKARALVEKLLRQYARFAAQA